MSGRGRGRGGKQRGAGVAQSKKVIEIKRPSTGGPKRGGGAGGVQKTAGGRKGRGGGTADARGNKPRRGGERGRGGGRGGQPRKPKTKEELDAEMDAYMLGDDKFAQKKLDNDMDEYWRSKPALEEGTAVEATAEEAAAT